MSNERQWFCPRCSCIKGGFLVSMFNIVAGRASLLQLLHPLPNLRRLPVQFDGSSGHPAPPVRPPLDPRWESYLRTLLSFLRPYTKP